MAIIILRLISSILLATSVSGFSPSATQPAKLSRVSSSKTQLFISSWGTKGSPYTSARSVEHENIEENLQAYLKEPEAVEARANIDGTVMVSGLVKSKERTDQTIFDLLNHEDSAFEFDKIVAFVDDMKFAKKRLCPAQLDTRDCWISSISRRLPVLETFQLLLIWKVSKVGLPLSMPRMINPRPWRMLKPLLDWPRLPPLWKM